MLIVFCSKTEAKYDLSHLLLLLFLITLCIPSCPLAYIHHHCVCQESHRYVRKATESDFPTCICSVLAEINNEWCLLSTRMKQRIIHTPSFLIAFLHVLYPYMIQNYLVLVFTNYV